jgi:hypothetical protein
MVDQADEYRELLETIATSDDHLMEKYLAGEDVTVTRSRSPCAPAYAGVRLRDPVRLGLQEQGRPADARRGHRLAEPARHPADARHRRTTRRSSIASRPSTSRSPLAFKIVADPLAS